MLIELNKKYMFVKTFFFFLEELVYALYTIESNRVSRSNAGMYS